MTDAERLAEIRAKLDDGSLSRHEAADLIRADRQWSKDRIVELEAEVERLRGVVEAAELGLALRDGMAAAPSVQHREACEQADVKLFNLLYALRAADRKALGELEAKPNG